MDGKWGYRMGERVMKEKLYFLSEEAFNRLIRSRRRYRIGIAILASILLLLGGYAFLLYQELAFERTLLAEAYDSFYDEMMREFHAVKHNPRLRRHIITKILSLARDYGIDPDLLFALVAVESGFNPRARSPKNARGLGQVMFATGKAMHPHLVKRPEDLYDIHINLSAAVKYLKTNLRWAKDLRKALMIYYYGEVAKRPGFRDRDNYALKVLSYYALLKLRRFQAMHRALRERPLPL